MRSLKVQSVKVRRLAGYRLRVWSVKLDGANRNRVEVFPFEGEGVKYNLVMVWGVKLEGAKCQPWGAKPSPVEGLTLKVDGLRVQA